jgi:hypothetical protein
VSCYGSSSRQVGKDVAAEMREALGTDPDLVLLFCAAEYDAREVLAGLYERLAPQVRVVGCSSCAEINSEEATSGSVTAMGLLLGDLVATVVHASDEHHDSAAIGRRLGAALAPVGASLVILFVDGIVLNSTPLLAGIQSVLGASAPIVGGVAADALTFTRTEEYMDREVLSGAAVALALSGPLEIRTIVAGGWQPLGSDRVITRASDSKTIAELDGMPALSVYQHYLGELGRDLDNAGLEFPIGVMAPSEGDAAQGERFIRAVQGATADGRGVRVSGDIVEGSRVRIMHASRDALIASAAAEVSSAVEHFTRPEAALIFDCAGRKVVLGSRYQDELRAAFAVLPAALPKIGFFTYGELAPHAGRTIHHDETFTAVLLRTKNDAQGM